MTVQTDNYVNADPSPIGGLAKPILDSQTTAVILLDRLLAIRYINPAGEQLLDQSARRLVGEPLPSLFDHLSLDISLISETLSAGHSFSDGEVTLIMPDGQQAIVELSASPMVHQQQRYALLEIKRIDQHRRISQEIFQTAQQQAARELIRGLAHEIKNPLGGLRGAAQLLERELPDPNLTEFTQIIIEQADRLRTLVDRMLGPQNAGQQGHYNIHMVLEKVRQLVGMELPENIVLQRDYDPSIPDFAMNPEQLQQAVLNIVKNAVDALAGKGTIKLVTRIASGVTLAGIRYKLAAEIRIIDDGPGIPPELQDTLFYPMVSGRSGGTGLGLSIAQTLVHQHGGRIDCSSWPGHTEFRIVLPTTKD